jgi:hypothetical protein
MFCIALGEAFWLKCVRSARKTLNGMDIALRSGILGAAHTDIYREYCQPDGAAVEMPAAHSVTTARSRALIHFAEMPDQTSAESRSLRSGRGISTLSHSLLLTNRRQHRATLQVLMARTARFLHTLCCITAPTNVTSRPVFRPPAATQHQKTLATAEINSMLPPACSMATDGMRMRRGSAPRNQQHRRTRNRDALPDGARMVRRR